MTLADYDNQLAEWCEELKIEARRLFESGVMPSECTGLAISIVESRRKKTSAARERVAIPVFPPRGH